MRLNVSVRSMTGHMKGLPHVHERIIMHHDEGRRESRGGLGKFFLIICVGKVNCWFDAFTRVREFVYTNRESITDYSTQAFTHWVQTMWKIKKQREAAAHNGENKSLMGPLKSLGARWGIPCSPRPFLVGVIIISWTQHSMQMNPEVVVKLQMRDGGEDCTDCFTGCVLLALECVCTRLAPPE